MCILTTLNLESCPIIFVVPKLLYGHLVRHTYHAYQRHLRSCCTRGLRAFAISLSYMTCLWYAVLGLYVYKKMANIRNQSLMCLSSGSDHEVGGEMSLQAVIIQLLYLVSLPEATYLYLCASCVRTFLI